MTPVLQTSAEPIQPEPPRPALVPSATQVPCAGSHAPAPGDLATFRPLSSNGTKNNAKELEQRVRIDQMYAMLLEPLRGQRIAEDVAMSGWTMHFRLGQLAGGFKRQGFYASLSAFALSTDSSGSCSASSSSRNGWKAP